MRWSVRQLPDPGLFEAWGGPGFESRLRATLGRQPLELLGIERATTHGGRVDPEDISLTLLSLQEEGEIRRVKLGVFFTEAVGGCNCADDPFTVNGYCERWVELEHPPRDLIVYDATD